MRFGYHCNAFDTGNIALVMLFPMKSLTHKKNNLRIISSEIRNFTRLSNTIKSN